MSIPVKRPRIGIQDVVYAVLTESSDVSGGTPTYGSPAALAGAMKFNTKHNGGLSTLFADDRAAFTANFVGKRQVSVDLFDVDPAAYATILGMTRANGINADSPLDQSPYVAIGYKILLAGSATTAEHYIYRWLLKGKFSKADEGGDTKADSINYQAVTLNAEFIDLAANGYYQTSIRTDDTDVAATTITNWFNAPVISTSVSLSAVTLSSGAGSTSGKTITLTFGKGSSESFSLVAPVDDTEVLVSVVSTGLLLAGTYTYSVSAAGTTPTLTIANANIAGVAYLVTVTSKLKDVNGVAVTPKSILVTPA